MKEKISRRIFQSSIGGLFGYFGILALMDPITEAGTWISPSIITLIEFIIPVSVFMLILGALQVTIAFLLILDKYTHIALPLAAVLLGGIIMNLGWNTVALRDLVILTGVGYLYFDITSHTEDYIR